MGRILNKIRLFFYTPKYPSINKKSGVKTIRPKNMDVNFNDWCVHIHTTDMENKFGKTNN